MPRIFLSLESQSTITVVEHVHCATATAIHLVAMYCLLRRTPPQQAAFRNYLLVIQALLFVQDIFLGALTMPIMFFPVPGGFCVGPLCRARLITPYAVANIAMLFHSFLGFSIFLCTIYRHQTLLPPSSSLRMSKRTLLLVRLICFPVFSAGPPVILILNRYSIDSDDSETERSLNTFAQDMDWIRSRGFPYFIQEKTQTITLLIYLLISVGLFYAFFMVAIFLHMLSVIQRGVGGGNVNSDAKIRRSIVILFVQLVIPLLVILIPGNIIFISMAVDAPIKYELCLFLYYVTTYHSVVHNLILLSTTPAYRVFIISAICCASQPSFMKIRVIVEGEVARISD